MSEVNNNNEILPLPGVVTGFRDDVETPISWDVVDSHGDLGVGVDFTAGVMTVPLRGDSHSQRVQLTQLVRARISPMDPEFYGQISKEYNNSLSPNLLRAAEHARVNALTEQFAVARGMEEEVDGSEKTKGRRLATANTPQAWDDAVQFTLLNAESKAFDSFAAGVRSVNPDWSKVLRKLSKRIHSNFSDNPRRLGSTTPIDYGHGVMGPAGFRHALYAANDVVGYLSNGNYAPDDIKAVQRKDEDDRAANYGEIDDESLQRGQLNNKNSPLDTDDIDDFFEFPDDASGFGPLRIADDLPLTVEVEGYMRRKKRSSDVGRRLGNPSRMLTDPGRRIFTRKVKTKGGVVIVDISGSMSLSEQDLNDIIQACPASLILAYSEVGEDEPNAWILANRGWRVKEIGHIGGGGNGVDGTALTWGIRHRKFNEDMVWISDGCVNNNYGGFNNQLAIMCAKLLKKHRMIMVPSVEEAVAMFKRGKLINKPAGYIRQALLGQFN